MEDDEKFINLQNYQQKNTEVQVSTLPIWIICEHPLHIVQRQARQLGGHQLILKITNNVQEMESYGSEIGNYPKLLKLEEEWD